MFLAPDLNCALLKQLKAHTNTNYILTLLDQCVHIVNLWEKSGGKFGEDKCFEDFEDCGVF